MNYSKVFSDIMLLASKHNFMFVISREGIKCTRDSWKNWEAVSNKTTLEECFYEISEKIEDRINKNILILEILEERLKEHSETRNILGI